MYICMYVYNSSFIVAHIYMYIYDNYVCVYWASTGTWICD